jgi:hypothetical protein
VGGNFCIICIVIDIFVQHEVNRHCRYSRGGNWQEENLVSGPAYSSIRVTPLRTFMQLASVSVLLVGDTRLESSDDIMLPHFDEICVISAVQ